MSFGRTHARSTDPITSHLAALQATQFAGTHCDRILACLKAHGPMTVDEIAERAGLMPQQVNKRLPDLQKNGKALPSGLVGVSASGRLERIWVAS